MSVRIEIALWQVWRWECRDPERDRYRYYMVHLRQDLWGRWELHRAWGGIRTRRGGEQVTPLGAREEGLPLVRQVHRRRLSRGYQLISGEVDVA
jgi:predicted DNA-binding WGR domain protein